ncbi:unnamed protein product [Blepharisma stoltei]|uniref:Uncharacterized protein n=1 Tax=Blepharisma stoltei TaxID=1481888 RepID=A0AAU9IY00_9CILI|nr:unnamed protein product [Blepharisma stoltei]
MGTRKVQGLYNSDFDRNVTNGVNIPLNYNFDANSFNEDRRYSMALPLHQQIHIPETHSFCKPRNEVIEDKYTPKPSKSINIDDPLISTTPIMHPKDSRTRAIPSINLEEQSQIADFQEGECKIEPWKRMIGNASELMLLKFQETLMVERTIMLEIINKDSKRDQLLLELTKKLETLNRENAILALENKGLHDMIHTWNSQII